MLARLWNTAVLPSRVALLSSSRQASVISCRDAGSTSFPSSMPRMTSCKQCIRSKTQGQAKVLGSRRSGTHLCQALSAFPALTQRHTCCCLTCEFVSGCNSAQRQAPILYVYTARCVATARTCAGHCTVRLRAEPALMFA
ncbi:hypothetical protein COO60DRAFT_1551123 [Scenedesmus sp. NREL 46B-D3]|nr:hypothetical protein COO60DRAFT_1551123 [Scenedesmus sp. NREL 46B-D3]